MGGLKPNMDQVLRANELLLMKVFPSRVSDASVEISGGTLIDSEKERQTEQWLQQFITSADTGNGVT